MELFTLVKGGLLCQSVAGAEDAMAAGTEVNKDTAEKSCINWSAKFQLPVQLEIETGKILKITSVGEWEVNVIIFWIKEWT